MAMGREGPACKSRREPLNPLPARADLDASPRAVDADKAFAQAFKTAAVSLA
jgi:hypothetical protein